jgi:hypothetical protein
MSTEYSKVTDKYSQFINLIENDLIRVTRSGHAYNERGKPIGFTQNGYKLIAAIIHDKEDKLLKVYLHRLVYRLYGGLIPKKYIVSFIDNNKNNCSIDNLKLISLSDYAKIYHNKPSSARYRFNLDDINKIKSMAESGVSINNLSSMFNVSRFAIYRLLNNISYKTVNWNNYDYCNLS